MNLRAFGLITIKFYRIGKDKAIKLGIIRNVTPTIIVV